MKLEAILIEAKAKVKYKSSGRSTSIDVKQLLALAEGEYSQAFAAFKKGVYFYRGIKSSEEMMLVDPTIEKRKSTGGSGRSLVNDIIDTSYFYEGYPRRSYSVIFTGSDDRADYFGEVYYCLPANDAEVAVSSVTDFMDQFYHEIGYEHLAWNTVYDLEDSIITICSNIAKLLKVKMNIFDGDAYEKIAALDKVYKKADKSKLLAAYKRKIFDFNEEDDESEMDDYDESHLEVVKDMFNHESILSFFDVLLDPKKFNIKKYSLPSLVKAKIHDQEMWTESKCVMLSHRYVENILGYLDDEDGEEDDEEYQDAARLRQLMFDTKYW